MRPLAQWTLWVTVIALACGAPETDSRAEPEPAPTAAPDATDSPIAVPEAPGDSPPSASRAIAIFFTRDEEPYPVRRDIGARTDVLTAALEELLRGPTTEEREAGIRSWFSEETANMLNEVTIDAAGHAVIDFADFRTAIPNASSSAGSAMLLGELNNTVGQFETVRSAEYLIEGSCETFWHFLQRDCEIVRFRD